jgi:hypothetical protein
MCRQRECGFTKIDPLKANMGNSALGKSRNETQQVSVTTSVSYLDLTRPVAAQTIHTTLL